MKYNEIFFKGFDGEELFLEDVAAAILLEDEILCILNVETKSNTPIAGLFVMCNDLFWWACADLEPITSDEIGDLYKECYDENGNRKHWGSSIWACLHRGMRPQHPIEKDMKKDGMWDVRLDALPEREFTG